MKTPQQLTMDPSARQQIHPQQIQNSQQQYFIQQHQLTSNPGNSSPHTMGMMSQMVPNASLNTMKSPMAQQQQIMQQQGKNIFLKLIFRSTCFSTKQFRIWNGDG